MQDNPNVSNAFQAFKAKDEAAKQKQTDARTVGDRRSLGSTVTVRT